MDFKKGDVVTWSSQAAGSWKTKTGVITEVWEYKKQTRYTVVLLPTHISTTEGVMTRSGGFFHTSETSQRFLSYETAAIHRPLKH